MSEMRPLVSDPLTACPSCGKPRLEPVRNGVVDNVICHSCGSCWHRGVEGFVQVDPLTCPGCTFRKVCLAALAERSP